jgi:hypothetical protein
MVSTLRSRPDHYEALGLTPAASDEDIRRAFVGKMSVFGTHPIAEAGQILVAYETLREPARRKAYDDSLGLSAKPGPHEWSFSVTPPRWAPFIASIPEQSAPAAEQPPEPHVAPEPVRPVLAPRPNPQEQRPRQPDPEVDLDAVIQRIRALGRAEKERLHRAKPESPNWKRVGLSLGGLVIGAGLLGTLAGISVKDNVDPAQSEPAETVTRPAAGQHATIAPPPTAARVETPLERPVRTGISQSRAVRSASRPGRWAEQMAQSLEASPSDSSAAEGAAAQPAANPEPAQAVEADLPLSNSVVARTIDRIGYACGEVASAAAVEGAPGVYKITCSSGQTYRAARVGGRYHFRRLAGR